MEVIEKHSRAIRWLHWVNFPLTALMVWSGVLIYWANPIYLPLPSGFVTFFAINQRLAEGLSWHFFLMPFFALNGLLYLIYLCFSGGWIEFNPFRKTSNPASAKFNPIQRLAYLAVLLMGAGSLVTGLAIYKPVQLGIITELLGGYEAARFEHFLCTAGVVGFFFIHVLQVMRAGWKTFCAMVMGYEEISSDKPSL